MNTDNGSGGPGTGGSSSGWAGLTKTTRRVAIAVIVFAVFVLGAFVASR